MQGCLLKVNGRPIPCVKLRKNRGQFEVVVPDPEFGEFALTPAFILDFLDLSIPKHLRESDPDSGWARVTYDELVEILKEFQANTQG